MFKGWLRGYEWALDKVHRLQAHHAAAHVCDLGRHILALHGRFRRASSRPRIPASFPRPPRRRPTSRSTRWPCCSARSRRSSGRTRRWITSIPPSASAGPNSTAQCRSDVRRAQAQEGARRTLDRGHSAAAPRRQCRVPAWRYISRMIQNINIARAHFQERVPVHAAIERHRRAVSRSRREMRDKIAKYRRSARRHHRPLHQESADDDRGRPREGGRLRHHDRPDPPGIVQRLRRAAGRDDLHGDQRLPGHSREPAEIPGRSVATVRTFSSRRMAPGPEPEVQPGLDPA